MTSWFEGYRKHFITVPLENNAALQEMQAKILKSKAPKHPLHLTLGVVHIAKETPYKTYFESDEFTRDVRGLYSLETNNLLKTGKAEFAIMGSKPECFVLMVDVGDAFKKFVRDFKNAFCLFITEKLKLTHSECLIDDKYNYVVLTTGDGLEVLKIPWSSDDTEHPPICHVTLFSSFDLKRCNKSLYKKYEASEDKLTFLSKECGDASALLSDK